MSQPQRQRARPETVFDTAESRLYPRMGELQHESSGDP
jgi:hypothetical protein